MADNKNDVKEIDLLELFQLIGKGIKNGFLAIIRAILFLIVFGIKKWYWMVAFVILGAALGLLRYSQTQRYYSSNLIAQPNGISAIEMVEYINDLTKFTKNKNAIALANSLELTDSTASKIKSIEAFYYIDINRDGKGDYVDLDNSYNPKDTNQVVANNRIYLLVEVFDNHAFSDVKNGLLNYIKKNPYLVQMNAIRKQQLEELIISTESEIVKLDSLQNIDYFKTDNRLSASNDNRLMFLSEKDKQLYYQDKMNLVRQKQYYERELEIATEPITVVKDFTQLSMEENPRGSYILKFVLTFSIIGYLLLLMLNYKHKITGVIYFDYDNESPK